jgi:hypothetical protein
MRSLFFRIHYPTLPIHTTLIVMGSEFGVAGGSSIFRDGSPLGGAAATIDVEPGPLRPYPTLQAPRSP